MREGLPTLLPDRDPWPKGFRNCGCELVVDEWCEMTTVVGNEKFGRPAKQGRRECSNNRGEVV